MRQFPIYEVYEVVRGDFMHRGGCAPGWYFDIPGNMNGPYKTEAAARRMCTRRRNEAKSGQRRAEITKLAYLSHEKAEEAMRSLHLTDEEAEEVVRIRAQALKLQARPKGALLSRSRAATGNSTKQGHGKGSGR